MAGARVSFGCRRHGYRRAGGHGCTCQPEDKMTVTRFCALMAALCPLAGHGQEDPVKVLVGRLDLESYKATIKGLAAFGDRRQGTDRNRAAVDWIESRLKSYGCATERLHYAYLPPPEA